LIPSSKFAAVLVPALAVALATVFYVRAQSQGHIANPTQSQAATASQINRNLVVLDPAHGGQDAGATLGDRILEKDVTLAFAARLQAALTSAGFTVVSTRQSDSANPPSSDQRAEIANRAHAMACLVIHATASGSGLHLYTSTLQPPVDNADPTGSANSPHAFVLMPWQKVQATSVTESLRLADVLTTTLGKANLPVVTGREPVSPLDNMECPAVAIELAPMSVAGGDATLLTDADYQQRAATTLTAALQAWRNQMSSSTAIAPVTAKDHAQASDSAAQAQVAAQAARVAAEAAGREAAGRVATRAAIVRSRTAPANQDVGQGQSKQDNAAPADSAADAGGNPAQTGGTQ